MGKPLNRQGGPWGGRLLSGALLIGLPLAALPAPAQLYGAGRNNGAVIVDEDVLSTLGGAGPRPGVGVGFLPAPPAPPRSKLNQVPPPKAKPAPTPMVAPPVVASPIAPAPTVAAPAAPAPATPVVPAPPPEAMSKPATPKPDPGPPPEAPKPVSPSQTAAVTPPSAGPGPAPVSSETGLRVLFLPDSPDVPTTARAALDTMVKRLQSQPDRRVLITAYAAGTPETASQSRRLSLNRALAVRSFLAEKGISTARLDVRALGAQVADGPADRVDIDLTTP